MGTFDDGSLDAAALLPWIADIKAVLQSRVESDGWMPCYWSDDSPADWYSDNRIMRCRRPLRKGFFEILQWDWEHCANDGYLIAGVIGVEYEPARRLLASLIGSPIIGVALPESLIEIDQAQSLDTKILADDLITWAKERGRTRGLSAMADVDQLTLLLKDAEVIPFVGDVADVDSIDPLHAQFAEAQLVPALLASATKHTEAREALARYEIVTAGDGWLPDVSQRFVRQLTRVLDSTGNFALPIGPPCWPTIAIARDTRRSVAAREDNRERAQNIESQVDDRHRYGSETLEKGQASFGSSDDAISKPATREDESAARMDTSDLRRPQRAGYPISAWSRCEVEVIIDPAARDWLDHVLHDKLQDRGAFVTLVEAWLTWDTSSSGRRLDVHMGSRRVGYLDAEIAVRYREPMDAATERDEDPWTYAHVSVVAEGARYRIQLPIW